MTDTIRSERPRYEKSQRRCEGDRPRVAIVYMLWPHYRSAVMRALDASDAVDYVFYGRLQDMHGIAHVPPDTVSCFVPAPFTMLGNLVWQPAALRVAFEKYDAIIYLGDMHCASTWIGAVVARLRGITVLMWGHGWRQHESWSKSRIRNLFFRLANHVLVYAERGRRLAVESGYPAERVTTVYNSLDVARADEVIDAIEHHGLATHLPQKCFAAADRPLVICTARLTSACRFDLLFEAAMQLRDGGAPINILLVGDGPERSRLEELAAEAGLDVHFFGACYDEAVLGQLIYHADVTVSPGKIGLSAMHSLMYGTPAITHGNLDDQMPEVESLIEGRTGSLFRQGDAAALAESLRTWLGSGRDRAQVRTECRAAVHEKWNPQVQARIIGDAVKQALTTRHS